MDEHRKMAIEVRAKIAKAVFEDKVSSRDIDEVEYKIIEDALRSTASKSEKDGYRIAAQEADSIKSHSTNHEDRRHTIHCYYADVGGAIRSLIREEGK